MCDPVTATVLAVSSVAASTIMQVQAANAQEKATREQMAAAIEENQRVASAELFDQSRAARVEQGRVMAAAGEAGLSLASGSLQGLLTDIAMQRSLQGDRSIANLESRQTQTVAEGASALSRIQKPTVLSAGLQLASAGVSTYSSASSLKLQRQAASASAAGRATNPKG